MLRRVIRKFAQNVNTAAVTPLTNLSTLEKSRHTGEVPKMPGNKILAGFGNPLLDITVKIEDDNLLRKYNLNRDDQKEIPVEEMNKLLEDIAQYQTTYHAGGCAQNTLRILQWILEKSGCTYMFGSIGDDDQGRILKEIVENDGVVTRYTTKKSYATGLSVDLVRGTDRSLVANIGAAEHFTIQDFSSDNTYIQTLNKSDYVYMEGFFLTQRTELAKYVLNYCKENQKPFVFNISGVYMCDLQPEDMKYIGENCDILFGNKREYTALSRIMKHEGDVKDFIVALTKRHPKKDYLPYGKIAVVTDGSKSVICCYGDGEYVNMNVSKIDKKQIKDTTGAGDSFVSGFLAGLFNEQKPEVCLAWGCWVSQKIIQEYGCTVPNYPPDEIKRVGG